jgi:hypothetical protein
MGAGEHPMKITKSQLKSIIKEEVTKLFEVKYVVVKPSQPLEKRFLQARKAGKMGDFGSMKDAAVFADKNYGDFLARKYGGEVQEKPESLDEITADQKKSHEKLVARAMELLTQSRKTDDIDKKEALMADARKLLDQAMGVEREAALNEDGHDDLPSAVRKLKTAMEDAHEILAGLQHHQGELPAWWMSKVTIAADYLNKARDYFLVSGELMEEEEMEERKLTPGEKESLIDLEKKVPMKDFIDQYGEKEGKDIYYATLTKMAKKR